MPGRHRKQCLQRPLAASSGDQGGNTRLPYEQQGRRNARNRNGNPHLHAINHNSHNSAYRPAAPLHSVHSQHRDHSNPGSGTPPRHNQPHARIEEVVTRASFLSAQLQAFVNGLVNFLKPDQEEMDWENTNTKELILVRNTSQDLREKIKPSLRLPVPDGAAAVHDTLAAPSHRSEGD